VFTVRLFVRSASFKEAVWKDHLLNLRTRCFAPLLPEGEESVLLAGGWTAKIVMPQPEGIFRAVLLRSFGGLNKALVLAI